MKRDYKQSENELRQCSRLPYVFSKATWNGRVSGADPELDFGRVFIQSMTLGAITALSCEKFLNTVLCYIKHCRLGAMALGPLDPSLQGGSPSGRTVSSPIVFSRNFHYRGAKGPPFPKSSHTTVIWASPTQWQDGCFWLGCTTTCWCPLQQHLKC